MSCVQITPSSVAIIVHFSGAGESVGKNGDELPLRPVGLSSRPGTSACSLDLPARPPGEVACFPSLAVLCDGATWSVVSPHLAESAHLYPHCLPATVNSGLVSKTKLRAFLSMVSREQGLEDKGEAGGLKPLEVWLCVCFGGLPWGRMDGIAHHPLLLLLGARGLYSPQGCLASCGVWPRGAPEGG